jgi:hypothetical protein
MFITGILGDDNAVLKMDSDVDESFCQTSRPLVQF